MSDKQATLGWGKTDAATGAEIWDTNPTFVGESVTWKEYTKLFFYPKKFFLYHWIKKARKQESKKARKLKSKKARKLKNKKAGLQEPFRILDVGCGTGASVIDFKKMFGRSVEVIGIDVVKLQIDLAEKKMKQYGVWAEVRWYDGRHIPFPDNYFDAIYTSDVLGHVEDVLGWLVEMNRVLKPGGVLAMFSESKLGRQAWIRKYLFDHGLNIDPHAEFHISLFSKAALQNLLNRSGFTIKRMYSGVWANFLLYPDEYYEKLQAQSGFPILKLINKYLYRIKKKFHPYSTAAVELYSLVEMWTIGRWIESQGFIVLAKKQES